MAAVGLNPLVYFDDVREVVTKILGLPATVSDSVIAIRIHEKEVRSALPETSVRLLDDMNQFRRSSSSVNRDELLNRTVDFLESAVGEMVEQHFPLDGVLALYRALPGTRHIICMDSELAFRILPYLQPDGAAYPQTIPAEYQRCVEVGCALLEDIIGLMAGTDVEEFVIAAYRVRQRLPQVLLPEFARFLVFASSETIVCFVASYLGTAIESKGMDRIRYMALWAGIAMLDGEIELVASLLEWFGLKGAALAFLENLKKGNPPGANHLAPVTNTTAGWAGAFVNFIQRYKRQQDRDFRLRAENVPLQLVCPAYYSKAKELFPDNITADCHNKHTTSGSLKAHLEAAHSHICVQELRDCENCRIPRWKTSADRTWTDQKCLDLEHGVNCCYPKNLPCMDDFIPTANAALDAFQIPHYVPPAVPHDDLALRVSRPTSYRRTDGSTLLIFRTYVQ